MSLDVVGHGATPSRRELSFPAKVLACFVEARLRVQVIFFLRLLAGLVLGRPAGTRIPAGRLIAVAVVWELAVLAAYLFDGVMDIVEDRLNGSARPIARGDLPRGFAIAVTVCASAGALTGALLLGGDYGLLVAVMLVLGYVYCAPPVRLKRWSGGAGVTVTIAGLLTFAAGAGVYGHARMTAPLVVFAIVMSAWMGLVGALAKDFSDIEGDAAAGCRTTALVRHGRAVKLVIGNALGVASVFLISASTIVPELRIASLVMIAGAIYVTFTTVTASANVSKAQRRRPYNAFMLTQYAVHGTVLANVVLLLA